MECDMMDNFSEKRLLRVNSHNIEDLTNISFNERNGFLLCRNGSITLNMDANDFCLGVNDLFIYPAFSDTVVKEYSKDFTAIVGKVEYGYSFVRLESVPDNSRIFANIRFKPLVSLREDVAREIEKLVDYIFEREESRRETNHLVVSSLVQALFYEVVGAYVEWMPKSQGRRSRMDMVFEQFIAELHSNFREHKDVKFYADSQCMSQRHFATQITAKTGKTPLQWIVLFVVAEAKHLLANPYKNIKEIAINLNFPDMSGFGRYFKRYTGLSPSDYRAKISAKKTFTGNSL